MAYLTETAPSPNRIIASAKRILAALGRAVVTNAEAEARLGKINALQAKSDAELARLGIARDDIVHHVFRDIYYV